MKRHALAVLLAVACLAATDSLARGSFSSGGRGGFSSGRSFSSSTRSFSAPRTTVTRTTTINRYYGGYHPMMYPGFGMGYGYSNGLIEGLIIGNLMHPQGTVVYTGGGYSGNALLYPDGRVVDQNGYQVGTYQNGQFTAVRGGMVAQPAPTDAMQPQPVMIGYSAEEIAGAVVIGLLVVLIIIAMLA